MTLTPGQPRLSWSEWLIYGATPDQRAGRLQATGLRDELRGLLQQLSHVKAASEAAIKDAVADLRDRNVAESLRGIPVERLKDHVKTVRPRLLEANGYRTLADLRGVSSARLRQISGIGPASSEQIVRAVNELCVHLQRERVDLPTPAQIGAKHAAVLRAAYQRVRCRDVSQADIAALENTVLSVETALGDVKRAGPIWRRIFSRTSSEPQVASAYCNLLQVNASTNCRDRLRKAQRLLDSLIPPAHLEELVADYEKRYADYFAVLERFLDQTTATALSQGISQDRGRYGSVPSQIADRVDAVELSLDMLKVDLRGYQEFGAKYLVHQRRTVLGDEMGLGKTIQSLAAMTHLKNAEGASHFFVVCPASIVGNWAREITNRTNIALRLVHGEGRTDEFRCWQCHGGVAVTSYETLRSLDVSSQQKIHFLVSDEAHYIKNPQAQRSINVRHLASVSDRIVLMTGTALENHPKEFVSLIHACDPVLGNALAKEAQSIKTMIGVKRFEQMVAPVYLRRNQEDVLRELPECIEVEELVTLSAKELVTYGELVDGGNVMAMRQAANGRSADSAKMQRLAELGKEYREASKKIVIFSYFLRSLDLAGEVLGEHFRIDGRVPPNKRMGLIDDFSKTKGFAPLVCQITAGGVGINLQSASAVILLEPQFKPTTEWQAIKRVHRMGQSTRVVVHRLVAHGTVDESLQILLAGKTELFNSYARESAIKDASPAAVDADDAELSRRLLEMELARRRSSKVG